jgi:hypothetical protein
MPCLNLGPALPGPRWRRVSRPAHHFEPVWCRYLCVGTASPRFRPNAGATVRTVRLASAGRTRGMKRGRKRGGSGRCPWRREPGVHRNLRGVIQRPARSRYSSSPRSTLRSSSPSQAGACPAVASRCRNLPRAARTWRRRARTRGAGPWGTEGNSTPASSAGGGGSGPAGVVHQAWPRIAWGRPITGGADPPSCGRQEYQDVKCRAVSALLLTIKSVIRVGS